MIVTEEEAKTKFCPETIQPVGTDDRVWHDGQNCIGSACMAWRWQASLSVNNPSHVPGEGQNVTRNRGYCGKAGRP